jgi:hypothetical protein
MPFAVRSFLFALTKPPPTADNRPLKDLSIIPAFSVSCLLLSSVFFSLL